MPSIPLGFKNSMLSSKNRVGSSFKFIETINQDSTKIKFPESVKN
jgi:hypothetical protein